MLGDPTASIFHCLVSLGIGPCFEMVLRRFGLVCCVNLFLLFLILYLHLWNYLVYSLCPLSLIVNLSRLLCVVGSEI